MPAEELKALIARLTTDDSTAPAILARGADAVPALIAALRHPNLQIRALARNLLITIGAPAVPDCVHALRDPFRRDALMVVLLRMQEPALLIERLPHQRANVQRFLRVLLQQMPPALVLPPLLAAYQTAQPDERMPLINALGMVAHPDSIAALLEIVQGPKDRLATHAVLALMEMQHDDATRALLLTLDHPDEWIATRTFSALVQLEDPAGVLLVKHALLSEREFLRIMGVRALPTLYEQDFLSYDDAADVLEKLKRDKQFTVAVVAQEALAQLDRAREHRTLRGDS